MVITAVVGVWRDNFTVARDTVGGSCVLSTKLAVAIFRRLRMSAAPMPCSIAVANERGQRAITAGVSPKDFPLGAWSVGCAMYEKSARALGTTEPHRVGGFTGHLVVWVPGALIDLTIQQFHRPNKGIEVRRPLVLASDVLDERPANSGIYRTTLDDITYVAYQVHPEAAHYRQTPAWRQDLDVARVDALVDQVIDRVTQLAAAT